MSTVFEANYTELKQAEAEIARLRAECVRLEDHINDADDESIRLRAEVERLRLCLQVIADQPDWTDHPARARAALATDGNGKGDQGTQGIGKELRLLASSLTKTAVESSVYSMVSQPGTNVVAVAADHLCAMARIIEQRDEVESLRADNERLTGLLRDWLLAHGYDRNDLRDEMATLTRAALAADGKGEIE